MRKPSSDGHHRGTTALPSEVSDLIDAAAVTDHEPLTDREVEILSWIARGKSDWEIGEILQISGKTVNFHVENVKRKFGVATRIQAVLVAVWARSGAAMRSASTPVAGPGDGRATTINAVIMAVLAIHHLAAQV